MQQYKDLMQMLLDQDFKGDRTGTGTLSKFGHSMRFDLNEGFPLVTLKKVPFHLIVKELLWFLEGNTNAKDLAAQGCNIWNEWATESGSVGKIYGKQWRSWDVPQHDALKEQVYELRKAIFFPECDMEDVKDEVLELERMITDPPAIDQIAEVIQQIKDKPHSRRLIVSAWNPADLPDESVSPQENVRNGKMALAACHTLFQFYVSNGKLSCLLFQRKLHCALVA